MYVEAVEREDGVAQGANVATMRPGSFFARRHWRAQSSWWSVLCDARVSHDARER